MLPHPTPPHPPTRRRRRRPRQILLLNKESNTKLKIADYGFAAIINKENGKGITDTELTEDLGTPGYKAPEVELRSLWKKRITKDGRPGKPHPTYGRPVDVWALGVITYILLFGEYPYDPHGIQKIEDMKIEFKEEFKDLISDHAHQFIRGMLEPDPKKRLTIFQLQQHVWIREGVAYKQHLSVSLVKLRNFQARRRWKKGANALRAAAAFKKFGSMSKSGSMVAKLKAAAIKMHEDEAKKAAKEKEEFETGKAGKGESAAKAGEASSPADAGVAASEVEIQVEG